MVASVIHARLKYCTYYLFFQHPSYLFCNSQLKVTNLAAIAIKEAYLRNVESASNNRGAFLQGTNVALCWHSEQKRHNRGNDRISAM
jgi:hypothetical protein